MVENVEFVGYCTLPLILTMAAFRAYSLENEELPFFIILYSDPLAGVQREERTKIRGTGHGQE